MRKLRRLTVKTSESAGFTLIELLVITVLIGIIAAIAAPSWLAYLNRQRANRASGDIAQVLQQAQSDAQQKSVQRVITITGNDAITVSSTSGAAGAVTQVGESGSNLVMGGSDTDGTATELTFDYKGTASAAPFVFSVTHETNELGDDSTRCVVVTTLLGNVVQAQGAECNPSAWVE